MTVEEYRSILYEDLAVSAAANVSSVEVEFLYYVTDLLAAGDEFDDFIECYYEGNGSRKGNPKIKIDGYAMDEADGSCCIFYEDYYGVNENASIKKDDIETYFKRVRNFVLEAIQREFFWNWKKVQRYMNLFDFCISMRITLLNFGFIC